MARRYAHIKQYEEVMAKMHSEGQSYRQIGEILGFSKEQVKECMRRPRRIAVKQESFIPKRQGRPAKATPTTLKALEKENERLRMENELLRDFLQATERK